MRRYLFPTRINRFVEKRLEGKVSCFHIDEDYLIGSDWRDLINM